jgi:L-iditol 2-dehydrogenase
MGHEFCGQVEEGRGGEAGSLAGQKMISHAIVHCGQCPACLRGDTNLCGGRQVFGMHRTGALAEYVAVPERILIPWPAGLPAASAIFAEPLANGINALRQGSSPRRSRIVVIGAGPIGLMCLFAAKRIHHANVVVSDRLAERLQAARILGADCTVNVLQQDLETEVRTHWSGERAEYVIDAVGNAETKRLALALVEPGGTVVWVGLHEDQMSLNSYAVTLGQKCVAGSYSGSLNDLKLAVQLLASENMDTSWATQYPMEQAATAFRDLLKEEEKKVKAIVQFHAAL